MKMRFVCVTCSAIVIAMAGLWSGSASAKTAKACEAEWKANKESIQASGKTRKAFIAECRASSETQPTAAPSNKPAAAPMTGRAVEEPAPKSRRARAAKPEAGQYASESEAKANCPGDTVVWANPRSKIYHFAGHREYGNTKRGGYACERQAQAAGYRAAKDEKHP